MGRYQKRKIWHYLKILAFIGFAFVILLFLQPSVRIILNCNQLEQPPCHHLKIDCKKWQELSHLKGNSKLKILSDEYLVNSPACKIPDLDPWHESVRELIRPLEPLVCSNIPPLSEVVEEKLVILQDNQKFYNKSGDLICCYQNIKRNDYKVFGYKADHTYELSECLPVKYSAELTSEHEFIIVRCTSNKKTVYSNMHATVSVQDRVLKKLLKNTSNRDEKMSVLMVGIDSVSRLNMVRTMPRSLSLLREMGWVELKGYNEVDDATFRNIMATLTGMNAQLVRKVCKWESHPLDNCPIIWKDFSEKGYVTGFGDDGVNRGVFSYELKGFTKPPTDYYLRPFMVAGESEMTLKYKDNSFICLGPTLTVDHVYKYATDFTSKFRNKPFFGLFWTISLSHDNISTSAAMDLPVLKLLQNLKKNGVLNNTFVVFFSDHGMRYGDIRMTQQGWLEERLPFNFIWVPEWYRKRYPEKYSNLIANKDKLTSAFDLHLTLKEILHGSAQKGTTSCPKCVSLFQPVPWNRSCNDAEILPHYCTCSPSQRIFMSLKELPSGKMAKLALDNINSLVDQSRNRTTAGCAQLSLNRVVALWTKDKDSDEYVLTFETTPGLAMFEVSIKYDKSGTIQLLGAASRVNMIGRTADCTRDLILKKYCFCTSLGSNHRLK